MTDNKQSFLEFQKKIQVKKSTKQGVSYAFRNAEEINNIWKEVSEGWEVVINYYVEVILERIFIKAVATASFDGESKSAQAYAELDSVPVFKTGNKQMQVPQWTGAVQSYAGKYALQALLGIGDEDVDSFPSDQNLTENNQKKVKTNVQKIAPVVATGYEAAIHSIIEKTGKNDGSITMWFMKELGVMKYEDITTDQQAKADKLIETLQKKLEKS